MAMTPLPDVALANRKAPAPRTALPARTAPATRAALAGAAALLTGSLVAACGSTAAPGSGGAGSGSTGSASARSTNSAGTASASTASAGTASAAKVSLDVTFAATPNSPAIHYTLRCEPAGGTTPDPALACARLLTGPSLFGSRPLHVMCPMMLADAARATVTGTYLGKAVHVTIINGGCDVSRWSKLQLIFR
jgi:hypothetical protein